MEAMARLCTACFLSAVRAVAPRCKHPLCPPPRPVPRRCEAHQGNYKGKEKHERQSKREGRKSPALMLFPRTPGVGRNSGSHPARTLMLFFFFFFLFIHYSRATYGDHGEVMYSPVRVRCPRSGGTLQAPLCPPPRPVPRKRDQNLDAGWCCGCRLCTCGWYGFFGLTILAFDLSRSWRHTFVCFSLPLSVRWRHVASSTFALRPGLSQEYVRRTKEISKEGQREEQRETVPRDLILACGCHEGGRG